MLKFKGNLSAKNIVDSTLKGKAATLLKKRKFNEIDPPSEISEPVKTETEKETPNLGHKYKTPAEISFDLVKKKRVMDRIERKLESSHKEKIEKFNKGLSKLSDHFDIPRVGPG